MTTKVKIGRNDKCHCGSGKKYKKCCLDKKQSGTMDCETNRHYFSLKGVTGEKFVHALAEKSFLTDWIYPNPKLPDGKELCDLLVVFGDVAIIWQVKNLKLGKDEKFKRSEVDKNNRQLSGAKRRLFDLNQKILLENPRRGKEDFDPKLIKQTFLISALLGGNESDYSFYEEYKSNHIHVFNEAFTEIALNELDTISDFIEYLQKKAEFLNLGKSVVITGGEENLLGYYLSNGRSFANFDKMDLCILHDDIWENLKTNPEFKKKYAENHISYGWDDIINRAHTASREYELVARELARPNRFQRKILSEAFFEAHKSAHLDQQNNSYRRVIKLNGFTFAFFFLDKNEPREYRKQMLVAICWYARSKFQDNKLVIGIATEKSFAPACSYDFCLLDFPEWTEEQQRHADKLVEDFGLFRDAKLVESHVDEFPKGL